jgi:hypothetical protein
MKRRIIKYTDGASAEIDVGGRWDLCLPNGSHVRGIATDSSIARTLVESAHNNWVLERWKKGSLAKGSLFVCTLRP